ncbi:hypothetical protein FB45DRAFT_236366 [Roridomyces roridus]|uniref:DUF6533 domain-containing protein n=1 Tax=Roridomyces roridus TaxID=1738132 RepID=A0AAD7BB60_9AGAR|nr:hypothetical protein FB45DRAFT_236366 [Roridomyces roridus]
MPGPPLRYGPNDYTQDQAEQYVHLTFINNYVLYSTACLLVYELFTTLDVEIDRIWSLKWRLPKILFMLNRYFIRAMLVVLWIVADYPGTSERFCWIYAYWQMIPLRLAILAAQALVVIRVWAIYNNSRRMLYVLSTLYFLEVAFVSICIAIATADTQGVAQPYPLSCALNSMSGYLLQRYASGTWIAPVVFEFLMMLITLAKLAPRWRWTTSDGAGKRTRRGVLGTGGNATLDVLARDSLVYFAFIFGFSLTNFVIYETSFGAYYHTVLLGPTSAVSCIAVSQMMINMRSLPIPGGSGATDSDNGGSNPEDMRLSVSFAEYYSRSRTTRHGVEAEEEGRRLPEYAGVPLASPGPMVGVHPDDASARTSGDATRVGDHEHEDAFEMGLWKSGYNAV